MSLVRTENELLKQSAKPFDTNALLELIKRLVMVDARWIPSEPGHSLYIRPTVIGTRTGYSMNNVRYL